VWLIFEIPHPKGLNDVLWESDPWVPLIVRGGGSDGLLKVVDPKCLILAFEVGLLW
jgi:hypothetical protein